MGNIRNDMIEMSGELFGMAGELAPCDHGFPPLSKEADTILDKLADHLETSLIPRMRDTARRCRNLR